jgi:hypothetical protein
MRGMDMRRFSEMMHDAHELYAFSHLRKSEDARIAWEDINSNIIAFLENSRSQNPALVADPRNVVQGVERLIFEANTPGLDAEYPRLRWLEVRG